MTDQEQREAWRRGADRWELHADEMREATLPVSEAMIAAIEPHPGQTVLELAAGPGDTGFLAAERLGADGTLISSDQSPEMVEVARRRAARLGLDNVRFETVDAQEVHYGLGPVDAVLCRFGLMLMGDPDAALRAIKSSLREGGRLALATWDTPDKNLWMAMPVIQLVARNAFALPDPGDPGPFSMADADALRERLQNHGFTQVSVEKVQFSQTYASFEQYWEIMLDLAAPLAAAMEHLDASATEEVRGAIRDALAQFAQPDDRLVVPASAVVAAAAA